MTPGYFGSAKYAIDNSYEIHLIFKFIIFQYIVLRFRKIRHYLASYLLDVLELAWLLSEMESFEIILFLLMGYNENIGMKIYSHNNTLT